MRLPLGSGLGWHLEGQDGTTSHIHRDLLKRCCHNKSGGSCCCKFPSFKVIPQVLDVEKRLPASLSLIFCLKHKKNVLVKKQYISIKIFKTNETGDNLREVDTPGGCSLSVDGSNHHMEAPQELVINIKGNQVCYTVTEQWPHYRVSIHMGLKRNRELYTA